MPFERAGEHVLLPVSINGSPPFRLVLDTGMPSPGIVLYEGPRVQALKLAFGPRRVRVGGAGGEGSTFEARIARYATLRIGDADFPEATATVLPDVPFLSALHDGIIGNEVFLNFVVTVDHDRGLVELTRQADFTPPRGAGEVAIDVVESVPYVEAGLLVDHGDPVPLRLVLDLGATHAVSLNASTHRAIVAPDRGFTTRIGRGLSGPVFGRAGRIPGLVLGRHRLENVVATFPDAAHENPRGLDSRNGNLGSGALGRFNVTFDYRARRMYLVPNRRFSDPFEWDMSGLSLEPTETGGLAADEVLPGSAAAAAGLVARDVLVDVDGRPVTGRDLPWVRERLRNHGADVVVRYRRGSEERAAKLRLRRMI